MVITKSFGYGLGTVVYPGGGNSYRSQIIVGYPRGKRTANLKHSELFKADTYLYGYGVAHHPIVNSLISRFGVEYRPSGEHIGTRCRHESVVEAYGDYAYGCNSLSGNYLISRFRFEQSGGEQHGTRSKRDAKYFDLFKELINVGFVG